MGASVQPVPQQAGPPVTRGDSIMANVQALRAQHASDDDVEAYLRQEGIAPDPNTALSLKNIGRSAANGLTFGNADAFGANPAAQSAFQQAHPNIDALIQGITGTVAPFAAMALAPSLGAGVGGALALNAAGGYLSGSGQARQQGGNLQDQAVAGAKSAVTNSLIGTLLHGMVRGAGYIGGTPERSVAKNAVNLLEPNAEGRMDRVEGIAPGGGSVATTTVPDIGAKVSRFLPALSQIGASPGAAADAENTVRGQRQALLTAKKGLGAQMDKIQGQIPIGPAEQPTMDQVKTILGKGAPTVANGALDVADARTALSDLRDAATTAAKEGNRVRDLGGGTRLHEINQTRDALAQIIYQHYPDFQSLDAKYSTVMDQLKQTKQVLSTVQGARNAGVNVPPPVTPGQAAVSAYRPTHALGALLDKILGQPAARADAINKLLVPTGGAEQVAALRQAANPGPYTADTRFTNPLSAAAIVAAKRKLTQNQQP